ncbi:mechanosensitive ion channel family protein [Paenibacillus glycanilyticus]|uniref:Membrane protein n=1 Tax=Paenibacillus glycanilyticus TaxID=126569 RepID=A0ABQ6GJX4_9BACL|nr:mechanosensitive ion channel domain-containing protein [Paenibacillus glycanilyticus]GLX70523.1 membrane protein [Paenibacillus glycanilyticus]
MNYIKDWFVELGISNGLANYLATISLVVIVGITCIAANFLTKKVVLRIVTHYIRNTRFQWDNFLLERRVFHKLSHIVPAIILYYFSFNFANYQALIAKGITIYLIIVALLVLDAFLNAVNDIYRTYDISRSRPIKGYVQVVEIFLFIIGGILAISTLIGESPVILISGIGALSAVMMLIFKDSLLGLVAGVQLTANDMVRVGDWIEMPKYGADGDIIDISLHTVKVQNFDKTITTIPSYALISDSFINWRGMQDAGGRRIKRSVYIDMNSIGFCTPEAIEKFKKIHVLSDYILDKEKEILHYNREHDIDSTVAVNGRAMTNIGVFRAYVERYIEQHPKIHKGMTKIVRQLAPGQNGLPLEIYAFTNNINWAVYEAVQSDLFDHILAVAPEFGLQVFQSPSGQDFRNNRAKSEVY